MSTTVISHELKRESKVSGFVRRHQLATFFILADVISWIFTIPLIASAQGLLNVQVPFALHYLTAYGPLLAAFIVTGMTYGVPGIRELVGRMVKWRVGWGWILVSVFSPLVLFVLSAIVVAIVGGTWPDLNLVGQVNFLPYLGIGAWILWLLTSGFGEETGWRGFALPHLQKRHSALVATLILTVFWVLWHLPAFFYLPNYMAMWPAGVPVFVMSVLYGAFIFTWLYNSALGSILMVALWHASFNYITASKMGEGAVAIIMSILVIVWAVAIVVIYKPANLSHKEKQVPD